MPDKNASFMEQRWEDILAKKGYVVDEVTETGWEDTLYLNPRSSARVIIHESGDSYYVVEVDGTLVTQGKDPDKLWDTLSNLPETQPPPVKHDRELSEDDMEMMGITASITSSLLHKSEPKMAFEFDNTTRKYDYEASGNDVVLTSPSNVTKLLQGAEAQDFWLAMDSLEEHTLDSQKAYDNQLQLLIKSVFDRDIPAVDATAKYTIQVDASSVKKASVSFVAGVEWYKGTVSKLKFTASRGRARRFSARIAKKIQTQLPEFKLTGSLVKE